MAGQCTNQVTEFVGEILAVYNSGNYMQVHVHAIMLIRH